jgi:hypothetical protein
MRNGKAFWPETQIRGLTITNKTRPVYYAITCDGQKRRYRRGSAHNVTVDNIKMNFNAIRNDDSLWIELMRILSAAGFTQRGNPRDLYFGSACFES